MPNASDFRSRRRSLFRQSLLLDSSNLGSRVVRGAGFQTIGIALRTLITLGSTAVLARLLVPADFGYVVMATVVTEFAALFAGFGFANLLIQRKRITRLQVDTVFWASIGVGCALALMVFAASFLAGRLFADPIVGTLLRVLCLTFALSGFNVVCWIVLARLMRFRVEFWLQIITVAVRAAAAIAFAIAGWGLWSLVAGALAGALTQAVLAFAAVPYLPRLRWQPSFLRNSWRTSGSYFAGGLLYYVNMNVDLLLIGRQLGAAPLGLYQTARSLTDEIRGRIAVPIQHVLFPAFSSVQEQPERQQQLLLRASRLLAAVVVPIGFGVSANASELVATLYGPKWMTMVPLIVAFGISAAIRASTAIASPVFNACDRMPLALVYNAIGTAIAVGSVAFAIPYGLSSVGLAVALSSAFGFVSLVAAFGLVGLPPWQVLVTLGPSMIAAGVMWAATWWLKEAGTLPHWSPPVLLGVQVIFGAVVYLVSLHLISRQYWIDLKKVLSVLRPAPAIPNRRDDVRVCLAPELSANWLRELDTSVNWIVVARESGEASAEQVQRIRGSWPPASDHPVSGCTSFSHEAQPLLAVALRREWVQRHGLSGAADLPPAWAFHRLLWDVALLLEEPAPDHWLLLALQQQWSEPARGHWHEAAAYGGWLERALLEPLQRADARGGVPDWMQRAAVQRLAHYLQVDSRPKAPTMATSAAERANWQALATKILRFLQPAQIRACGTLGLPFELQEALLGFHHKPQVSVAWLEHHDIEAGLLRVSYYTHHDSQEEDWRLNGYGVEPVFAKLRSCNFFGRSLVTQRIAWLPVSGQAVAEISLHVGGRPVVLEWGSPRAPKVVDARGRIGDSFPGSVRLGPGGRGALVSEPPMPDWRAHLTLALAGAWPMSERYRSAWLFADSEAAADDNAEHLYRWVRRFHPEVNAWFLLRRSSPHWMRLSAEGFRLVEPGFGARLLLLNASYVISSHMDYAEGGLDRRRYGKSMNWRFVAIPHGISKDDVSHWFNSVRIDLIATTSPAERDSMAADGTGYLLTPREAVFTGLPRHDSLLQLLTQTPPEEVRLFLVMPTWRASLFDERTVAADEAERLQLVRQSAFATQWREVLGHPALHAALRGAGLRMGFMAHANLVPLIEAFGLPPEVEVFQAGRDPFQPLLCRTVALLTDFTSVAFEVAYLRRAVFYFQPDREAFYRRDHNLRPGFFDYDRDGFGPVAFSVDQLVGEIQAFTTAGCRVPQPYLSRMERLMPRTARPSCELVFEAIQRLRQAAPANDGLDCASGHNLTP